VKGNASNIAGLYPAEDTVSGTWKHESGVIGSGTWCFVVDETSERDEIEIIGEKGTISLPCFVKGNLSVTTNSGTKEMEFTNPEHISQNLIKQVIGELRGEEKCVSTGVSAARTSWVLDEIVNEYYSNKPHKAH
jgi:predicted dehydrogenase